MSIDKKTEKIVLIQTGINAEQKGSCACRQTRRLTRECVGNHVGDALDIRNREATLYDSFHPSNDTTVF